MGELRHFIRTKLGLWTEIFNLKCRMKKVLVDQRYIEYMMTIFNGSIKYSDGLSVEVKCLDTIQLAPPNIPDFRQVHRQAIKYIV